jgi:hypothetical protein
MGDNNMVAVIALHAPKHMQDELRDFVEFGARPDAFLTAVLANDLYSALAHADATNAANMGHYHPILTALPPMAWGSYREVEGWIEQGGLVGPKCWVNYGW